MSSGKIEYQIVFDCIKFVHSHNRFNFSFHSSVSTTSIKRERESVCVYSCVCLREKGNVFVRL